MPKEAPAGFCIAETPPTKEQLTFSKEASVADEMVGCSILYNWPIVGWSAATPQTSLSDTHTHMNMT